MTSWNRGRGSLELKIFFLYSWPRLLPVRVRLLSGKRGRTNASAPTRVLLLLQRRLVALVDFFPVDYAPPRLQILGAAVVVFEVVGVLPDVIAEDGIEALRDGTVLVGSGDDFHFAFCVACQPYPSAAELAYSGGVEFLLEGFEVAESLLDHVGDGTAGIASALGLHDFPEHGVVHVAAGVVADGAADVFGDSVQVAKQIVRSFLVQLGMLVEGRVEVLDVRGVMHVVMQVHRLFVDGRFERRVVIRQGGDFMRHFHFLQSLCHFLFLQSLRDDGVWLKDSCGAGLVAAEMPYICNTLEGAMERSARAHDLIFWIAAAVWGMNLSQAARVD